ncbi:MAG: two-component sensor histidine kinase, partial [Sediminibacterium sp.]|nr:two-component sensor histidine kinase [Sediminibacterium sp.]
ELRTPLATMLSQTESALSREMTIDAYQKLLLSLKDDQQELIELTNSLLLISQYDESAYKENWPRLRIDEILYETVSYCKRMFPGLVAAIRFNTIPDNDDDFTIRGNESLLKSAFTNLVKNAYMYSVDKKANITLESDGDTIRVHVDSTGTQLPADEKDRIMVPFFRGDNALTTKGYGLGLAIVSRFVQLHKGTVTYTPISNDVNRFTVALKTSPASPK